MVDAVCRAGNRVEIRNPLNQLHTVVATMAHLDEGLSAVELHKRFHHFLADGRDFTGCPAFGHTMAGHTAAENLQAALQIRV